MDGKPGRITPPVLWEAWIMRALLFFFVCATVVIPCHAATLFLRWEGQSGDTLALAPRASARVEVWVELLDGETLSTVYFGNTANPRVGQLATSANLTGWTAGGTGDNVSLGDGGQQVAFFTPGTDVLSGPGLFLVGHQTLRAIFGAQNDSLTISLAHDLVGVLDSAGAPYVFDNRFNTTIPGFVAYGDFGNPGWVGGGPGVGQPTPNPLRITLTATSMPDFDLDGDVDLDDHAALAAALNGPGHPPLGNPAIDADADGDADLADFSILQAAFSNPMAANTFDPCAACPDADVNLDGVADLTDVLEIRALSNWFATATSAGNPRADVDGSGLVDGGDIAFVHSPPCWQLIVPCPE